MKQPLLGDVYKRQLLVFLLMMLSGAAIAQNNTNSPYTRYGYGQLADQGSGNSKAMGGIAYGLRAVSYTHLDVYKRQAAFLVAILSSSAKVEVNSWVGAVFWSV